MSSVAVLDRVETQTDAPAAAGLRIRSFRGEADYAVMHRIIAGAQEEDQTEWSTSVEDIARNYRHLRGTMPPNRAVIDAFEARWLAEFGSLPEEDA